MVVALAVARGDRLGTDCPAISTWRRAIAAGEGGAEQRGASYSAWRQHREDEVADDSSWQSSMKICSGLIQSGSDGPRRSARRPGTSCGETDDFDTGGYACSHSGSRWVEPARRSEKDAGDASIIVAPIAAGAAPLPPLVAVQQQSGKRVKPISTIIRRGFSMRMF